MHTTESLKVGLHGLLSNKTRALLTMLGILFGVASVIAMMSIGEGARQETLQQIELLGTNNIIINKKVVSLPGTTEKMQFSPGLTLKDAESVQKINPFIESITPVRESEFEVAYRSVVENMKIIGTTPNYPLTFNSRILSGSFFKEYHYAEYANVCVIGFGVKEKFFRFADPLKERIKIGNQWFQIIGVVAPKNISSAGTKSFGIRNFNEDIYVPFSTMSTKMEKVEVNEQVVQMTRRGMRFTTEDAIKMVDKLSVDQVTVKVKNSDQLRQAAALIEKILDRRHFGIKDFDIILPEQLLEQKQKTQKIFNVVMGAIAGISLLVGGIGIMNIMLANIMERTREIGTRRAVGATKNDILAQFLFEAIIMSITGGIMGILTGFILTKLISSYANWNTVISLTAVFVSFFISVATGIIFGIYPAKKAADKNPIESLRYE